MTTYIIYSDPNDGEIQSYAADYNAARNKSGSTVNVNTTGTYARTGQNVDWAGNKYVYESFYSFDTSVIVDAEEIVDAQLSMWAGWTGNNQKEAWGQQFHAINWTAPVTASSWIPMASFTSSTLAANIDYLNPNTPFQNRSTGDDLLLPKINKTGLTKLVAVSNRSIGGWAPTGTEEIWVSTGNTADKPALVVYTTVTSVMNMVSTASVSLVDGTTVNIRSNGGADPTLTVGYTTLTGSWTSLGTLDAKFSEIDGANSIAMCADEVGNVFIIGVLAGTAGTIVAQAYKRTAPTTWQPMTPLTQALPAGNGMTIRSIAASYVAGGTDSTDKPSIYIMTARGASGNRPNFPNHVGGAGWVQDNRLLPGELLSGAGNPLWGGVNHYSPHTQCGVPTFVDVVSLDNNFQAVYVQRGKIGNTTFGGISTIRIYNGDGYVLRNDSQYTPTGASQLVALNQNLFAHVFDNNSTKLSVRFYNLQCQILGEASIDAVNFQNGTIGDKFAAYYDKVSDRVRVYFMSSANADGRVLGRFDVSPTTYAGVLTLNEYATLGLTGSTSTTLRIPHGPVDERKILVEGANLNGTTQSLHFTSSLVGNFAPTAPVLVSHPNYDATQASRFEWSSTDNNPKDFQTKFQIEVSRVSDSVVVYNPTVTSLVASHTVPANTLANGVSYRWRVRTYDTTDTAGAWSGYLTFNTSATGQYVITTPATDNLPSEDSSVTVSWSYSNVNGQVQSQRRVRVVRTSDGGVHSDTGMQVTASLSYTITGLTSGQEYRVELDGISSGSIAIPLVSRLITPQYSEPIAPSIQLTAMDEYIEVQIVNPVPTGSRPEVAYNDIYRRRTNVALEDWKLVATVNNNAVYRDYSVKSDTSFDYYVIGRTN